MELDMRTTMRPKLAGRIVVDEYARQGLNREQAAERMRMSPSTLDRIRDGDDRITGPKMRSVEGALNLPDNLLTNIIEGDLAAIDAIGGTEMRPGMRRVIVTGLANIDGQDSEGNRDEQGAVEVRPATRRMPLYSRRRRASRGLPVTLTLGAAPVAHPLVPRGRASFTQAQSAAHDGHGSWAALVSKGAQALVRNWQSRPNG
jgi:transcriptional regulator with XRE-family HTH domain